MDTKNKLGLRIQKLLADNGLENSVNLNMVELWQNDDQQIRLKHKYAEFLELLGFNLDNESVSKTPQRVVEFITNELFYGLNYQNFPEISIIQNDFKYTTPLVSNGIRVNSTCEHHLVAINGMAVVAYIPTDTIIGLSKINRVVDFFAKRPQVQERMTQQIFVVLQDILSTDNIAVAIKAVHYCITMRGTKDQDSEILTAITGGVFDTDSILKANIYQLINKMSIK